MSTLGTIGLSFALGIAVWAVLDYVYLGRGRTPRGERLCAACGHERGWHTNYWPMRWGIIYGCSHPARPGSAFRDCGCPAGRRSIR